MNRSTVSVKGGRDGRFDAVKGVAIMCVVLTHVMQHTIADFGNSFLFNLIFSIQMPLFMLLSGYFSISRKQRSFFSKLGNKAVRYLVPFFSFFVIRRVIFGGHYYRL